MNALSSSDFRNGLVELRPRLMWRAQKFLQIPPQDREDVVHDTIACALEFEESFTVGTNLEAWVSYMMLNLFRNKLHRNRLVMFVPILTPLNDRDMFDAEGGGTAKIRSHFVISINEVEYCGHQGDPQISVELQQVIEAIRTLPCESRDTFYLAVIQGYDYCEVGEQLGISQGTVKSRVSRAREKLYAKLGVKGSA